jgi:NAD-dependent dihydropyrimidine dehydrogenase PreA subunit
MAPTQVPREKIPWYPAVSAEKCNGCRVCFEFCQQGIYAWDEEKSIAKVVRPFSCVVGCSGCQGLCPVGAISFPEIDAINEIIRKLREG